MTKRLMVICKPYDLAIVPFPFTDRQSAKRRPALTLSSAGFNAQSGHTVFAMVTSAANPSWPMDVMIDAAAAGLSAPSKVRMKLFTLDNRLIIRIAGSLSRGDQRLIRAALNRVLAA